MAGEVGREISEALCLGGSEHRRDLDVLPVALGAPQAFEEHEPAGTVQPGDQAADVGRADLSQRGKLSAPGAGDRRRTTRRMDGRQPLLEYRPAPRTDQ